MADALAVHRVARGAMAGRTVGVAEEWLAAGTPPTGIAVLARVNSALLPVQVALGEAGVATTAPLDRGVLRRTGIRTALAYLRIGLDPDRIRREDVMETINRPTRRLKSAVRPFLERSGRLSMARLEDLGGALDGRRKTRFEGYLGDLRALVGALTEGADAGRCFTLIRERIGLGEAMDALDASTTRPQGSSHGDDLDALEQLAALRPDPVGFGAWLGDRLAEPGDDDGVMLSTVHRVKGMEWDRVVVFAANDGLMPHRLADDDEEERRVFHVAVTRCREGVAIVADRERTSPFVDQLRRPAPPGRAAPEDAAPPRDVAVRPTGDGAVVADPGLPVELPGGIPGRVADADRAGATVRLADGGRVRVPFATPVVVDGETTRLGPVPDATVVRPRMPLDGDADAEAGGGDERELDGRGQAVFEQLRDWRSRTAREQSVPAYVVLHDAHLRAIAARRPSTARELGACPGIGPTRLDRYGDDILDIVAEEADD